MFKVHFFLVSIMLAAALLAGCSSGPDVRVDHDPGVDFSEFKTYNFFEPLSIDNPGYSTIYSQLFKNAISREMNARGYTQSDQPDLLFNVSANLQDKTKVTTYNDPAPAGYYGYRRGRYGAWGGYAHSTSTHVDQYTEGTINVDMVATRANNMVWEGVAVGRLKEDRSNEELQENINAAVAEMFSEYPFGANQ